MEAQMMTRALFIATLLCAVGVTAVDRLTACGDKYLNIGVGTRYQRSTAERRASAVLVYANAGSELSRLVATLSVQDAMRKAGYVPAFASTSADLDLALTTRTWDVIVVDGRDTQAVVLRLQKPAGTRVVPVLSKPTKEELKQAEKAYDVVLNTPSKNRAFVDVVDDAMDLHEIEMADAARVAKKASRR
jgi:hypothetical protein